MKTEFLAHVSHELRTPMASIQEGTHLLLDEIPGPLVQEQRTTLRIMADSSRRLIHLISTILDLSKMEAGMMEYRIVPVDFQRIGDISINKVRLWRTQTCAVGAGKYRGAFLVKADASSRTGTRQLAVKRSEIQP